MAAPDARIYFTAATETQDVNWKGTATITAHVDVDTGSGFTAAPNGTVINFNTQTGAGQSFTGGVASCTVAGGNGECSVQLTDGIKEVTTQRATTSVTVSGSLLLRRTNDGLSGDGVDSTITWVRPNAYAHII